jgi:hypothetical protein
VRSEKRETHPSQFALLNSLTDSSGQHPALAPLEQLVHPLGDQANRGVKWGFLIGVGGGMALTSILNADRQRDVTQIGAGLGTWLASMLVGLLIGHRQDPIVTRVSYPPELQLVLSLAGQDSGQTASGDRAGKLLIEVRNVGKGRALKARLGLAVLQSGAPTSACYQGATLLGDIESGGRRQAAIDVSTCNMPAGYGFTLGVTCTYETQWGATDQKTSRIVLTSRTQIPR